MANVLVTGGSGLIGWRVTEQLVQEGHKVVAFDLNPSQANLDLIDGQFEVVKGDVSDIGLILRVLAQHKITHIVHLAAMIGGPAAFEPGKCFAVNTVATAELFDAAMAAGVSRIVWASSVMACGVDNSYRGEMTDETYNGAPTTSYGASKLGAEIVAKIYNELYGLEAICIRPCLAFGIGREGGGSGFLADAVKNAVAGKPAVLYGHGVPHQPIYDRDMAAMFVKALFAPMTKNLVFNTLVLRNYTMEELKEAFLSVFPEATVDLATFTSAHLPPPLVSGERARAELGFEPKYTLEQALREMADHYRSAAS